MTTDLKTFGEKLARPIAGMSKDIERMTSHPLILATLEMSKVVLCKNGLHADERGLDNLTDCLNIADCAATLAVGRAQKMQLDPERDAEQIAEIDKLLAEGEALMLEGFEAVTKRIGLGNQPTPAEDRPTETVLGVAIIDLTDR